MKFFFICLLLSSSAVSAFSQKTKKTYPDYQLNESYKPGKRLIAGGSLVGLGGALIAGGLVVSSNTTANDSKTVVQALTIAGGAGALIGGLLISSAGSSFIIQKKRESAYFQFRGNSIALVF